MVGSMYNLTSDHPRNSIQPINLPHLHSGSTARTACMQHACLYINTYARLNATHGHILIIDSPNLFPYR